MYVVQSLSQESLTIDADSGWLKSGPNGLDREKVETITLVVTVTDVNNATQGQTATGIKFLLILRT